MAGQRRRCVTELTVPLLRRCTSVHTFSGIGIWIGFRSLGKRAGKPSSLCFVFNYALQPFKAYCATCVRRCNFRHLASPRVSPRESTQRRKVELWARNVRGFCLNVDLHVTFRDLLHAVKLRHGTDGFTSPPKEGVLRIFSP